MSQWDMIPPPRPKVFFFHYNKPASKAAGRTQISVHYGGQCYIVEDVDVRVPTKGHHNKRQPFFVIKGKGVLRLHSDVTGGREYKWITAILDKS